MATKPKTTTKKPAPCCEERAATASLLLGFAHGSLFRAVLELGKILPKNHEILNKLNEDFSYLERHINRIYYPRDDKAVETDLDDE